MSIRLRFLFVAITLVAASCSPDHPTMTVHDAAKADNLDQIKSNLYWGCDVNAFGDDGATALHWAAFHGNVDAVEALLAKGADREAQTKLSAEVFAPGMNSLHVCSAPVVGTLLKGSHSLLNSLAGEWRGEAGVIRPSGQTALHFAVRYGDEKKVRSLLDAGIDKTIKDDAGATALDVGMQSLSSETDKNMRGLIQAAIAPLQTK